jgi:diguanylate cyclase (GGDEF)-like protein
MWPLPRSLRLRISLLFGLTGLLAGLMLAFLISALYRTHLQADRNAALAALARSVTSVLRVELDARTDEVRQLARCLGLAGEDELRDAPAAELAPANSADPSGIASALLAVGDGEERPFVWVGFADVRGRLRHATDGLLVGRNVSERPWFRAGRDAATLGSSHATPTLAPFLKSSSGGLPQRLLDVSAPVRNARGELLGVLGAHVDVTRLQVAASRLHPLFEGFPDGQVLLVDSLGVLSLLHGSPRRPGVAVGSAIPEDWGDGGRWSWAQRAFSTDEEHALAPLKVVVRAPTAELEREVDELGRLVLLVVLFATALLTGLAWLAADGIVHPVAELTEMARRVVRAGRPPGPGDIHVASRELQELADALFDLSERVAAGQAALKASDSTREAGERERDRLARLLLTDPLTGIANRRAVEYRLEAAFHQVRNGQLQASLLMLDVDHFKRVNDTLGHALGDTALVAVARVLSSTVRASDYPARFGGEEFVCLLPGTRLQEAMRVAEKVREAVAGSEIPGIGRLTVSIGVACLEPTDSGPERALERADAALYAAKRAGRNRVCGPPSLSD